MRYLGIDYGTKKVGVALSDEGGTMAFPYGVIQNTKTLASDIAEIASKNNVGDIVIGTSIGNEGVPNAVEGEIVTFIEHLKHVTGLHIDREPEYYTTKEAERIQGHTAHTDASAAALILNSYLLKHSL